MEKVSSTALLEVPRTPSRDAGRNRDTRLPSVDEFLTILDDEAKETALNISGYSVYHKYNKTC